MQHFTVNVYYIFVFNFSQIQDARNCSDRMMRKFAYVSEFVVANKWWKSLVSMSVIKKCLLKTEDKYLSKMLLELAV